jgi:hypothetical protein
MLLLMLLPLSDGKAPVPYQGGLKKNAAEQQQIFVKVVLEPSLLRRSVCSVKCGVV